MDSTQLLPSQNHNKLKNPKRSTYIYKCLALKTSLCAMLFPTHNWEALVGNHRGQAARSLHACFTWHITDKKVSGSPRVSLTDAFLCGTGTVISMRHEILLCTSWCVFINGDTYMHEQLCVHAGARGWHHVSSFLPCLLIDWLDLLASKPAASCVSALFQKHPASMRELEVKSQSLVFTLWALYAVSHLPRPKGDFFSTGINRMGIKDVC